MSDCARPHTADCAAQWEQAYYKAIDINSALREEKLRVERLAAGALCSLMRGSWQPGPSEEEIKDDLWAYFDAPDNGFPLSNDKATDDSRNEWLCAAYEGKISV